MLFWPSFSQGRPTLNYILSKKINLMFGLFLLDGNSIRQTGRVTYDFHSPVSVDTSVLASGWALRENPVRRFQNKNTERYAMREFPLNHLDAFIWSILRRTPCRLLALVCGLVELQSDGWWWWWRGYSGRRIFSPPPPHHLPHPITRPRSSTGVTWRPKHKLRVRIRERQTQKVVRMYGTCELKKKTRNRREQQGGWFFFIKKRKETLLNEDRRSYRGYLKLLMT